MKVVCSMVTSIDGFIADQEGKSVSTPSDWEEFRKLAKQHNNFVVGRKTFEKGGFDNIDCYFKIVVSTQSLSDSNFIHASNPEDVLAKLNGKVETVYLVGGRQLNTAFLQMGLINEVVLTIQPRLVGDGVTLFDNLNISQQLRLLKSDELTDGRIRLSYGVKVPN
jgi:dihydrofolate reductase